MVDATTFCPPSPVEEDYFLSSYCYDLPEELIAQHPPAERGQSRLMVVNRAEGTCEHTTFQSLCDYLPKGALLIVNNSKVLPARLLGHRASGGKVEFLLLTPLPLITATPCAHADVPCTQSPHTTACSVSFQNANEIAAQSSDMKANALGSLEKASGTSLQEVNASALDVHNNASEALVQDRCSVSEGWYYAEVEGLLRASKALRSGEVLSFGGALRVEVLERGDFGRSRVRLYWQGDLAYLFTEQGHLPLPPYIRRADAKADADRYQTVFAREDCLGSVAAPTAGLHFTPEIRERLAERGVEWAEVTLYVGYGTFSPVRCDDIREHAMHREYVSISQETVDAIARAKAEGRPVVAVGTTSSRVLEGVALQCGELAPYSGWVNIFMYPGYEFRVVEQLITNFHLPESSLLMLVSAFAGRKQILDMYREAVAQKYRFFSYGDAMLLR